jgi:glucan 1,3-beta-glucosidase
MRADTANGGISQLENHYKTFIVGLLFIILRMHLTSFS